MSIRLRFIIAFAITIAGGFYYLSGWILDELRPRYLESVEESLVDTAETLAGFVADTIKRSPQTTPALLKQIFKEVSDRSFKAQIYQLTKTNVDLRVYITDEKGWVVFDSSGTDVGQDYSQWRNVWLTLHGQYGARTSHTDNPHNLESVLHVTAPIIKDGSLIGTLTVAKPTTSINLFIESARPHFVGAAFIAALILILIGMGASLWLTRPLHLLTRYARNVRDGKKIAPPRLSGNEIVELGQAFEEMKKALEGKKYVEEYVQSLTHELKSPLTAIQGASELIDENMPEVERKKFLENIRTETERMRSLVDRMLQLSNLENITELEGKTSVDLKSIMDKSISHVENLLWDKHITLENHVPMDLHIVGEPLLLEQAFINLLVNAIEFTPQQGRIVVQGLKSNGVIKIRIEDSGPGFPDYALPKIFNRFYSLPRPDTGKKSTGLGLSFVKLIMELHEATITANNLSTGGASIELTFL